MLAGCRVDCWHAKTCLHWCSLAPIHITAVAMLLCKIRRIREAHACLALLVSFLSSHLLIPPCASLPLHHSLPPPPPLPSPPLHCPPPPPVAALLPPLHGPQPRGALSLGTRSAALRLSLPSLSPPLPCSARCHPSWSPSWLRGSLSAGMRQRQLCARPRGRHS